MGKNVSNFSDIVKLEEKCSGNLFNVKGHTILHCV